MQSLPTSTIKLMSLSCLDELAPDMSLDFRGLAVIIAVDLRAACAQGGPECHIWS